ncbi:MAG TPA: hypothetical protein DEB70_12610 [Planctomycetaceae bacterium]|nr:hypothetical protein [Planctomycetaceae bacterium]|tara:strand:+ start:305 stop:673 length:369 start_codon:yes stop_codon:yes gene_type:complete
MKRLKNYQMKAIYIISFLSLGTWLLGCTSKEPPPSEVIEIETIEILDLNKNDGSVKPSTAETEVDKARAARQSADAAKAAADREIEAAEKSVSRSDKQPTGTVESEITDKSEPKEPPSDASN